MRKCRQQLVAERSRNDCMHGAIPPGRSGPIPAGMDVASENRLRSYLLVESEASILRASPKPRPIISALLSLVGTRRVVGRVPRPSRARGLTSICATHQVLAHVQEADIEISEGLVPPAGTVRFNAKGVSRSVACRSVALPAVRSGELRGSALVALPAVRSVELRPSTLVADRLSHPPQAVPSLA